MSHLPFVETESLENRLRKNFKHFRRWARRRELEAYRLYDADLDEFPMTIDVYGEQLYVEIYTDRGAAAWRAIPEPIRTEGLTKIFEEVLGVKAPEVQFKNQSGLEEELEYEKRGKQSGIFSVVEKDLKFWVALEDSLVTGLLLDQRQIREMIREQSAEKSVLNLFAYTGSFTVAAVAGGALKTHTIDNSSANLKWAQRNLELNDLAGEEHRFEKADVLAWLAGNPTEKYDLIVLASSSFVDEKYKEDGQDMQRDHVQLINNCIRRLSPEGTLYFSARNRRFKLETAALQVTSIKEISQQTVPDDFRKGGVHRCWKLT